MISRHWLTLVHVYSQLIRISLIKLDRHYLLSIQHNLMLTRPVNTGFYDVTQMSRFPFRHIQKNSKLAAIYEKGLCSLQIVDTWKTCFWLVEINIAKQAWLQAPLLSMNGYWAMSVEVNTYVMTSFSGQKC